MSPLYTYTLLHKCPLIQTKTLKIRKKFFLKMCACVLYMYTIESTYGKCMYRRTHTKLQIAVHFEQGVFFIHYVYGIDGHTQCPAVGGQRQGRRQTFPVVYIFIFFNIMQGIQTPVLLVFLKIRYMDSIICITSLSEVYFYFDHQLI